MSRIDHDIVRFEATPQAILDRQQEIHRLARSDHEFANNYGVDLNPYSTAGPRSLWQRGWDGELLPEGIQVGSWNWRAWERGRASHEIANERNYATQAPK